MDPKRIEYIHWQDTTDHTKKNTISPKEKSENKTNVYHPIPTLLFKGYIRKNVELIQVI